MKASPIQGNFNSGEVSPLYQGRVGDERYKNALALSSNWIPTLLGGMINRQGTRFVQPVKDPTNKVRIIPFEYSKTDAFILEFGHQYIRFFKDYGQLTLGLAVYEISSPFTEDEIEAINISQTADVLYLYHTAHITQKLSRHSDVQWFLETVDFRNGPFEREPRPNSGFTASDVGVGSRTITAVVSSRGSISAITNNDGRFEITISGAVNNLYAKFTKLRVAYFSGTPSAEGDWDVEYIGSNKFILLGSTYSGSYGGSGASIYDQIFTQNDVGTKLKLGIYGTVGKLTKITAVAHSHSATVTVEEELASAIGLVGYFSLYKTGNGAAAGCFHDDRHFLIGAPSEPQRVDGSCPSDYENFEPTESDGSVISSNGVSFLLNSAQVNRCKWIFSDEKGALIGTSASNWVIKGASGQEPISPTSISAKQSEPMGSNDCYPVQVGKAVLFTQKTGRRLSEFSYLYDVDGFRNVDLNTLAIHMTVTGIKRLAFQKDPHSIVWAVRNDGKLVALTYERDPDNLRAGWHQHPLGGDGFVEDIAVIPSPDGLYDDLWLVVRREVDGVQQRYIEVLSKFFEDDAPLEEAFYLDCGLSLNEPKTVTAITKAATAVVSCMAHGFNNGDQVTGFEFKGMTELNRNTYVVANKTTDSFEINVDSTNFGTFKSGVFRKKVSTISGLDHLEGQTVGVVGDGGLQADKVVTGGSITLQHPAALVHVGLRYNADAKLLRFEAGAADGTALGKLRRTHKTGMLLHRTLNLLLGTSFTKMYRLAQRKPTTPIGHPTSLLSGIVSETLDANSDFDNQICIRQDQPFPAAVLAVMPQMVTQDGG